jgi:hypothetical protein
VEVFGNRPAGRRLRSDILEFYRRQSKSVVRAARGPIAKIQFPDTFSFFSDPDLVLAHLNQFVAAALRQDVRRIEILQRSCKYIGHAAESVLNALAIEAYRKLLLSFAGQFPVDPDQRDVVLATGLPKYIGVRVPNPHHFKTFPLRRGGRTTERARTSPTRDRIGTDLPVYVDECLADFGYRLSEEARQQLGSIVGEVLTNAESHSGQPHWWVSGYLRKLTEQGYADCHITIFNFGKSLAETMQTLPNSARLKTEIRSLVRHHRGKGYFGKNWNEEALWTLAAMQEGGSRNNRHPVVIENNGQGIPDIIQYFQELGRLAQSTGNDRPQMFLLSGNTFVLFDDRFPLIKMKLRDGSRRRVVALNAQNDLRLPPHKGLVRVLKRRFPGTLIGMDFFLDPGHLERLVQQ